MAVFLCAGPLSVRADYTATVSPGSVLATNFQGWGTSLCWWANVAGGYTNLTEYADLAFTQLKLNIVRYNIGGGQNPGVSDPNQAYYTIMPGFEPTNGVWNWNADLNQRAVLKAAEARGANLVEAFANSPPWWMCVNSNVDGGTGGTNNLQVDCETNFAIYLATVVSNLTVLDGDHFNYVTPMNEPSLAWNDANQSQEGCHMSNDQQGRVINDLRAALNTSLPSAGIDAPEDYDEYEGYEDLTAYSSTTLGNIALISTHTYKQNDPTSLGDEAAALKKPLWVAEYGDNDSTGLTLAKHIHDDITGMPGVRAWINWQVVSGPGGGWGCIVNTLAAPTSSSYSMSYTLAEKFYVMGQFSEFIRPGCNIISVNDTNTLAAYTASNSTLVLVMVNTNTDSFNVTYNLSAFGSVSWQLAVSQTTASESLASLPAPVVANQQFTSAIPAQSVTTFVLTTNIIPPTITSQSPAAYTNGIVLYAGQVPTFSVSAAGTLPLHYKWWSNGVALAGATNASYTPAATQLSSLTNLNCTVSNLAGTATSLVWSSVSVVPAPAASYPRAVQALNPIGYWRLDEPPDNQSGNQGAICHDYVGGNDGVYSNVVLAQPGYSKLVEPTEDSTRFGTFLSSNSAAGQITGLDFSAPSGSNGEFSVAAWVNGSGYNQKLNAGIVTKGYFYGEELDLDEGAPGNCLRFEVRNAAGTAYNANSTINAYNNSGWHHLVGVCDEANGNVLLYIDGALAGSAAIPANSGITNSASVPLTIGARAQSATTGNNEQFAGWLDDVAIFDYALSSNQVQTMYQAGTALAPVTLTVTNLGGNLLQFNWSYGTLQSATNAAGPFGDLTNATQPCTITATNAWQFYRVREN